jgi:hypothetical protein
MSVTTTTARIAAIYTTITGIKKAVDFAPRVLLPVDCPAVIIIPGESTYDTDTLGDDDVLETRTYRATLFYGQTLLNTETAQQTGLIALLDNIRDTLIARPGLELIGSDEIVADHKLLSDSGVTLTQYPTGKEQLSDFWTVEFRHQVQEVATIAYVK